MTDCLQSSGELGWQLELLSPVSKEKWGSVWRKTGHMGVVLAKFHQLPLLPTWRRFEGDLVKCLA